ncbi:Uncharacterised protein [uncultured archaeon]|nr:Uncharacterised protein [uncultured archaeon]
MLNDGITGGTQSEKDINEICASFETKYKAAGYSQETIRCIYEVLLDYGKYCFLKALYRVASSSKINTLNTYSAVDPDKVLDMTEGELSEYFSEYKHGVMPQEKIDAGELIQYFKDNDLIEYMSPDGGFETIAITNNGINVFSEVFDIEHFVGFPAFRNLLEKNSEAAPNVIYDSIYGKAGVFSAIFEGIKVS